MTKPLKLKIPVQVRTAAGDLIDGPAGLSVKLKESGDGLYDHSAITDEQGIATFDMVPPASLVASLDKEASEQNETYGLDQSAI